MGSRNEFLYFPIKTHRGTFFFFTLSDVKEEHEPDEVWDEMGRLA